MARKQIPPQSVFPYHVTARCINREWFNQPLPEVWSLMSDHLNFITHAFEVEILAFVLMSNHFHLLIRTPQLNLSAAMQWLLGQTSRELTRSADRINQTFGGRHFKSVISSNHYFMHAYKYLYLNPVRAGLCWRSEDYKFSTLHGLLGQSHLSIPVIEDTLLFSDPTWTLDWINQMPSDENWEAVRKGLRWREFKLAKEGRAPHQLETLLL